MSIWGGWRGEVYFLLTLMFPSVGYCYPGSTLCFAVAVANGVIMGIYTHAPREYGGGGEVEAL